MRLHASDLPIQPRNRLLRQLVLRIQLHDVFHPRVEIRLKLRKRLHRRRTGKKRLPQALAQLPGLPRQICVILRDDRFRSVLTPGTVDAPVHGFQAHRHERLVEEGEHVAQGRFRPCDQIGVLHSAHHVSTQRLFRQHASLHGTQPVRACLLHALGQRAAIVLVEAQHGRHHIVHIAHDVHEPRIREEFVQSTNIQRVFRRAVDPARLGLVATSRHAESSADLQRIALCRCMADRFQAPAMIVQ